jgi:hypothetical protein
VFDVRGDRRRHLARDEPVGLTLFHAGSVRHLKLMPSATEPDRQSVVTFAINWAGNLLCVLCGILIALRRQDPGPHRILAIVLITVGYGTELYALPSLACDLYFRIIFPIVSVYAWLVFTYFTLIFPPEAPLLRKPAVRYLFGLLSAAGAALLVLQLVTRNQILPGSLATNVPVGTFYTLFFSACTFSAVLALAWSWARSSGQVRRKVLWIALSLGVLNLTWVVVLINNAMGDPIDAVALYSAMNLARCAAALLLVYALLSRRMIDMGFALNRALVVAVISSVLLVAFALTEFAVDKLLHFHGRQTSMVIDAAVALGIILSFHRIQHWVNHQVNHFFFHHWFEAAEKLRHFLDGAAHITDAAALQEKTALAIAAFGDASAVAVYRQRDDGSHAVAYRTGDAMPAMFDANDDVIVALRHRRRAFESGDVLALPLFARGVVTGMVLVGPKRTGQAYRPDELALLTQTAAQLGLNLESLRVLTIEHELRTARQSEREWAVRCEAFERLIDQRLAKIPTAAERVAAT